MEMMLSEKQIGGIFLLEFKMCHKAVETTCSINNAFDPRTANEHTVQWWFKEFCKGDERLEDEVHNGGPLEIVNDQLRASSKELSVDHYMVLRHLKQVGMVKRA